MLPTLQSAALVGVTIQVPAEVETNFPLPSSAQPVAVPFETEYVTEISRKVEVVSVNGKSKESLTESEGIKVTDSKPKVTISDIKNDNTLLIKEHAYRINKNITKSNLNIFKKEDKNKVIKAIQNYLIENSCVIVVKKLKAN